MLEAVHRVPGVDRTFLATRGYLVQETARFAASELLGRPGVRRYHLRSTGHACLVRHGTFDVRGLDEIFWRGFYDLPDEAGAALAARPGPVRMLDCGGHVGLASLWALKAFGDTTQITAFEPDPANNVIHDRVRRSALAAGVGAWSLERAAVGAEAGTTRFHASGDENSRATDDGELEVPVVDLLTHLPGADLLKLDVEGAEWPILADPRLAARPGPAVIVMEIHADGCPQPDHQAEATRLLALAGYQAEVTEDMGPGGALVCAWRSDG
ncbi:methyltransferase [Paraconexibacter sp. AEG42_29]|uniref:Methyltransferase n=2 Tax=Paraconexibacter sp. AEG42_29 TaxID=2997339 RepID=A0AAU7ANP6_9ACTN